MREIELVEEMGKMGTWVMELKFKDLGTLIVIGQFGDALSLCDALSA